MPLRSLTPAKHLNAWKAMREASLNRLAAEVERALDTKKVFEWAGCTYMAPDSGIVRGAGSGVVQ